MSLSSFAAFEQLKGFNDVRFVRQKRPSVSLLLGWFSVAGLFASNIAFAGGPPDESSSDEAPSLLNSTEKTCDLAAQVAVPKRSILPPKLLAQAPLVYPEGASGEATVTVLVTVSVDGEVIDAVVVNGPEPFHVVALNAARQLIFNSATQEGVPVEVKLPATFRFAPPILESNDDLGIDEVVIHARRHLPLDTRSRTIIDAAALERSGGQDLAEAVSQVAGVALTRGTADSTKPIIRGQTERRLLVLFDDVRHESQKWGSDHATEIDPFSAGSISVVKGASGVRYGPDAIGGVLLITPHPMRTTPGVNGTLQTIGVSNGRRGILALRIDAKPASVPSLSLRVEGNIAKGGSLSTPDYVLGNTGSELWNLGVTAQVRNARGTWTVSWHHYDLSAGICFCASHHSLSDLQNAIANATPLGSDRWTPSYAIDRPYQTVSHERTLLRSVTPLGSGSLQVTYAFQLNRRREYEQVRQAVVGPQYDFTLRTHSLDITLSNDDWSLGSLGVLNGIIGLSGGFQENVYSGLPLIPNHRALNGGVFGLTHLTKGRATVELGARYDLQRRASFLTDSAFNRLITRGVGSVDGCEKTNAAVRCDVSFSAASVSTGLLWQVIPDRLELKVDLSSANRFPNGDELYMNGSAPTSPIFAVGNPSQRVETTWGASPTVGLSLPWLNIETSAYANRIDRYIYFAPELKEDGSPRYDVTIRGAYPRFTYQPVNALFYGTDGGLSIGPDWPVGVEVQGAMVRALDRDKGDWLLFVPPDRARAALVGRLPNRAHFIDGFARLTLQTVAKQTRVTSGADLAEPPKAYTLVSASLGGTVPLRDERALKVSVEINNIVNTRYRDYTSLLRYYADEAGREIRVRFAADF